MVRERDLARLGLRTTYYCLSVSNVERLHKALGPLSEGVVVTQVMPSVRTSTMPVVRDYRRAAAGPDFSLPAIGCAGTMWARGKSGARRVIVPLTEPKSVTIAPSARAGAIASANAR